MTRPDPPADDPALQEVQDAYRDLPPIEPDAALDARVRAAVAAEVLAGEPAAPGRRAAVIPFRRWRRVAVPLTAAAAVLVAIGVGRLQPPAPALAPTAGPDLAAKLERTVVPEAAPQMQMLAAPAPGKPAPPPPISRPVPSVSTALMGLARDAAPPPAQADLQAGGAADNRMREERLERSANDVVAQAKVSASLGAAAPASPAARRALAAPLAESSDDNAVFAEIRRLLAEHRREDARVRLKRWRETHLEAPLPVDLEALAAEPGR